MKIDCLVLGSFETNAYILRPSDKPGPCVVIDPGPESEALMDVLRFGGLKPAAVILTHGHVDHIAGVSEMDKAFPGIPLYIHRLDLPMLTDPVKNLSAFLGAPCEVSRSAVPVEDGGSIEEGGLRLKVIHTPGHTPGGMSLYHEIDGVLFTGDALFQGSIGRTDFPGGRHAELVTGIRKRLLVLPEETRVFPGHGPETSIGLEKRHNPFRKEKGSGYQFTRR